MSDEIFEIVSHSVDVAALGQDYSDRVDGERILLCLPQALSIGDEVRFVVLLLDGTPAFAGAGRCLQVSDQGHEAGTSRYETLIDSLAFDERSAPVYEYIVQVRQLAYQQGEDAGMDVGRVSVDAGDVDVAVGDEDAAWNADEAAATRVSRGSIPAEAQRMMRSMEKYDLDGATMEMRSMHANAAAAQNDRPTPVPEAPHSVRPARGGRSQLPEPSEPHALDASSQRGVQLPTYATVPPEPLKTGILTRPALAAHWAPAAPRPPQRSLRPTGFQSKPGPLAVPSVPPRPALDRSQWVERAPAPQ